MQSTSATDVAASEPGMQAPRVDLTAARSQGLTVQSTSQTDATVSEPGVQGVSSECDPTTVTHPVRPSGPDCL